MGNLVGGQASALPRVRLQVEPGLELSVPVTGPQAEVQGFSITLPVDHIPSQADADALSGSFQTLYDALPEAQKLLMSALIGQAADYTEQAWSGGAAGE